MTDDQPEREQTTDVLANLRGRPPCGDKRIELLFEVAASEIDAARRVVEAARTWRDIICGATRNTTMAKVELDDANRGV